MRTRTLGAVLLILALLAVERWTLHLGGPGVGGGPRVLTWYGICWLSAAAVVAAMWAVPRRVAVGLIVAGGIAVQCVAMTFAPTTTDDYMRYLWDGDVQAHGVDPYRYTPVDPALQRLRDPLIFPAPGGTAVGPVPYCGFAAPGQGCTRINRPEVRTIYPPVAEAAFLGLHEISPQEHRVRFAQAVMAGFATATLAALFWLLRRLGRDPRWAAVWAFCPTVWLECANNAHIDVLGALFLLGALGVGARTGGRWRVVAVGALFGCAVAVKLIPALVAPGLMARRTRLLLASAAATIGLTYVPHVAAVGTEVLGYLPGYLHEEGYAGQQRFGVPRLLVGAGLAPYLTATVLAVTAALVWRRAATRPAADGALIVAGIAFVLVGPSEPWYGTLVVVLAAAACRPEWWAIAAAAYPVYNRDWLGHHGTGDARMQQYCYLPAAVVVLTVTLARRRIAGRRTEPGAAAG